MELQRSGRRGRMIRLVKRSRGWASATLILLSLPPATVGAQSVAVDRPRIGVVLSGGGAKGMAHIGVLRVLEEAGVPIDVVTGTSMGGLIGGLRASGLGAVELERIAKEIDWSRLFTDAPERGQLYPDRRFDGGRTALTLPLVNGRPQLPAGVVGGKSIYRLIARLTWPVQVVTDFRQLPIPFAAVATDLETGTAVRLDNGVLADALRATMSIPGVFDPVWLNGKLLIDGGVIRNLPASDAVALGADLLICSDVTEPLARAGSIRSAFDVLFQTVSFRMVSSTEDERSLCDILIVPGSDGESGFSFANVEAWIERGVRAAEPFKARLREMTSTASVAATEPRASADRLSPSVRVSRIELRGVDGKPRDLALRTLAIEPGEITADRMDTAIGNLYSTEMFNTATYHVAIEGADTSLVIDVAAARRGEVGFGFRYDDKYKASLLSTASLYNLLDYGSLTRVDLRLGEQLMLGGHYSRGRGLSTPFTINGDVILARVPLDVYAGTLAPLDANPNGARVAVVRTSLIRTTILVGSTVGRYGLFGGLAGLEWSRVATAIAPADTSQRETLSTLGALYRMDTLDRNAFPTRGVSILARAEWAVPLIGNNDFFMHFADLRAAVPLTATFSTWFRAYAGLGRGDVPYHRLFFLGGTNAPGVFSETQPTFHGLSPQERSGHAIQAATIGLQWELRPDVFLTAQANAGATADRWSADLRDYSDGWSLSLGTLTLAGPIEVSLAGRRGGPTSAHFSIGHNF